MIAASRRLWRLIHQPPLRDPEARRREVPRPLRRLLRQQFAPHAGSLVLAAVLVSASSLVVYAYAAAGRFIADEVVQVGLLAQDVPASADHDPASLAARDEFLISAARERESLDSRFESRPGRSTREKVALLGFVALAMVLVEIARHTTWALALERIVRVGQSVQFRLRQKIHDKLLRLPLAYHDRHTPGRLLTHVFTDVSVIQQQLTHLLIYVPTYLTLMLVGLAICAWLNPTMTLCVLPAIPAYAVAYRWFSTRLANVNANLREREGRLNGHIANRVGNFAVVKAFGHETREAIDFVRQARPLMGDNVASAVLGSAFAVTCGLITGGCMTAVLWTGAIRVRDGSMSLGDLLMFYGSATYLFSPVAALTALVAMYHRTLAVASRVMGLLDEPEMSEVEPGPVRMGARAPEIRFEDVRFEHQAGRTPALAGVSFTLPAGRKLCVMGPSGAGKSTLAKLACRLYDPVAGRVLYDGVDAREILLADLRRHASMVSQEPIVFSGTLEENIRYGAVGAPPQAVTAAARYAQIEDFIDQLPRRYRTATAERGLTLSGGQKQRLTLARALLSDPKVLVLDDCTSALDARTEQQIIETFDASMRDRTVILVSHRVSIAMQCDLVLMLEAGQAVELGPPDELLQQDGAFAQMCRAQNQRALLHGELALAS